MAKNEVRIIGGKWRGRKLKFPDAKGLRPSQGRARETLFNWLASWVLDARVLDLFAGTGALGLEALSRGAAHVTFIDKGRVARRLILQNIERARAEGQTRFLLRDATRFGPADAPGANLVFCDPPYGRDLAGMALVAAHQAGWIAGGAVVVAEDQGGTEPPTGFSLEDSRRYGDTTLSFLVAGD